MMVLPYIGRVMCSPGVKWTRTLTLLACLISVYEAHGIATTVSCVCIQPTSAVLTSSSVCGDDAVQLAHFITVLFRIGKAIHTRNRFSMPYVTPVGVNDAATPAC